MLFQFYELKIPEVVLKFVTVISYDGAIHIINYFTV